MSTIQSLLDTLGPPPPEVCVDWAWQLDSLLDDECDDGLGWEAIEVQPNGELCLLDSVPKERGSIAAHETSIPEVSVRSRLIRQLLIWGGVSEGEIASDDVRQSLVTRTLAFRPEAAAMADAAASELQHHSQLKNEASRLSASAKPVSQRTNNQKRGIPIVWILGGGLVALLLGVTWFVVNQRNTAPIAKEALSGMAGGPSQLKQELSDANSGWGDLRRDESESELETSLTPTLEDLPLSSADASDAHHDSDNRAEISGDGVDEDLFGLSRSIDLGDLSERGVEDPSNSRATGEAAELDRAVDAEVGESIAQNADWEAKAPDLMQELQRVTEQAESKIAEIEVAADGDEEQRPPLDLRLSPMLQLQKLPVDRTIRVRKPGWKIRLGVSEGIQVLPTEPQMLLGRNVLVWQITDPDAEEDAAKIVVMAQANGNRTDSIRWRIFASSDSEPRMQLPMQRQLLDDLQTMVSASTSQLQTMIDSLRSIGQTPGLQSAERSAINAQRRFCEKQIELGRQVLGVVAGANQMEGWLDGQVQVHAQLVDTGQANSTALLQFGTFPEPMDLSDVPSEPAGGAD